MSRGGRGNNPQQAMRTLANTLGIPRNELKASYAAVKADPASEHPNYPPLPRNPLPLEAAKTPENIYMTDLKQELLQRLHSSPFYMVLQEKRDIRRWSDRYKEKCAPEFEPDWSRLPKELNWKKAPEGGEPVIKRRKTDEAGLKLHLEKLAKKESANRKEIGGDHDGEEDAPDNENEEKAEDEKDDEGDGESDAEPPSDEDQLEEDNDYIQSYFDDGDDAGGSDDNLEGDDS